MIRDLLTPEAHRDPYVWAAVLVAHAGIGVALWAFIGGLLTIAMLYAGFEICQMLVNRRAFYWDSVLDWCGIMLGACLGLAIETDEVVGKSAAVASIVIVAAVGAWVRSGGARPR